MATSQHQRRELAMKTEQSPFCVLKITLSYREFAMLRDIHDEMWAFVGSIEAPALCTLGGHDDIATAMLVTAMEQWKEEREGRDPETSSTRIRSTGRACGLRETL